MQAPQPPPLFSGLTALANPFDCDELEHSRKLRRVASEIPSEIKQPTLKDDKTTDYQEEVSMRVQLLLQAPLNEIIQLIFLLDDSVYICGLLIDQYVVGNRLSDACELIRGIPDVQERVKKISLMVSRLVEVDDLDLLKLLFTSLPLIERNFFMHTSALCYTQKGNYDRAISLYMSMTTGSLKYLCFQQILEKTPYKQELLTNTLRILVTDNKIEDALQIVTLCPNPENERFEIGKHLIDSNNLAKITLILDQMSSRKEELISLLPPPYAFPIASVHLS